MAPWVLAVFFIRFVLTPRLVKRTLPREAGAIETKRQRCQFLTVAAAHHRNPRFCSRTRSWRPTMHVAWMRPNTAPTTERLDTDVIPGGSGRDALGQNPLSVGGNGFLGEIEHDGPRRATSQGSQGSRC